MSEGSVSLASGLVLRNVLYGPNLKCCLISVSKLIFDSHCLDIYNGGLCIIHDQITRLLIVLMHQRLGQSASQHLSYILGSSSSKIKNHIDSCNVCPPAKQTPNKFVLSQNKADSFFDLIHFDLWGPYYAIT